MFTIAVDEFAHVFFINSTSWKITGGGGMAHDGITTKVQTLFSVDDGNVQ